MQIKQLGMATPLKIEHRCVIKFCVNANMTPTDTLKFMEKGDSNVSRSLVFGWHKKFRDGLEDVIYYYAIMHFYLNKLYLPEYCVIINNTYFSIVSI